MTITQRQNARLHAAKKKLNLSEAEYRCALIHVAGAASVTDLDLPGCCAVIGLFAYMGFVPPTRTGKDYGQRLGLTSLPSLR